MSAGVGAISVPVLTMVVAPAHGIAHLVVIAAGGLVALPLLSIAAGGLVVICRDVTVARGNRDLFQSLNDSRSEAAIASGKRDLGLQLRHLVRTLLGIKSLAVGDEVETLAFDQIRHTLDHADCLDGLPFMPEMVEMCGRRARVFRRVDKIYDYGGQKVLRRMENTVLLVLPRCSGAGHGGCQAGCHLMWKEAWLRPARAKHLASALSSQGGPVASVRPQATIDVAGVVTYRCQFTQLVAASVATLDPRDPRPELRPLIAGNITCIAWALALLTRWFNRVQLRRGGNTFPSMSGAATPSLIPARSLIAGEVVRVESAANIAQTLDKGSKHRGLWFDRDMVKHCGRPQVVLKRVDRIIDDATGRMRTMKTPCIVLQDVTYSGEYLRFLAQEEHLYWREAWLQPTRPVQVTTDRRAASGD